MYVNVTAEDIAQGEPMDAEYCPIARAVSHTEAGRGRVVEVGPTTIAIFEGDEMTTYKLPPEAVDFVRNFDYAGNLAGVLPFDFIAERQGAVSIYAPPL